MADFKDLLKMALQPVLVAGAAGYGARYANTRYKWGINPWIAGIVGAGVGYVVGRQVQSYLAPPPAPAPVAQVAPQGPPRVELQFPSEEGAYQLSPGQPEAPQAAPQATDAEDPPEGIFSGAGFADGELDFGSGEGDPN